MPRIGEALLERRLFVLFFGGEVLRERRLLVVFLDGGGFQPFAMKTLCASDSHVGSTLTSTFVSSLDTTARP